MEPQEKKYRVDDLGRFREILAQRNAPETKHVTATHYYGHHDGSGVEKFVVYPDRCEVHVFAESDGKFTLTDHFPIPDMSAGIAWLRDRGYRRADIVKMEYTDYAYRNGTVGLYTINDFLRSVILYYPPGDHDAVARDFGLQNAEVISVPYNTLLAGMNKLDFLEIPKQS